MSRSGDSDEELPISSPIKRKGKTKRVKTLDSEEDSDSDAPGSRKRKTLSKARSRKCDSDDVSSGDQTPHNKIMKTPVTRSSDRLRIKNSREFKMPSKEEVLENVSPGVIQSSSSSKKISGLRPRRLVNNFIRERNSYASERGGDIYETDESLSDFINDDDDGEEEDEDESDGSSTASSTDQKSKLSRKRKHHPASTESESDDNTTRKKGKKTNDIKKSEKNSQKRRKSLRTLKKKKAIDSSSEDTESENTTDIHVSLSADSNGKKRLKKKSNEKKNKNVKRKIVSAKRQILDSSSDSTNTSDSPEYEKKVNPESSNEATVRRSSRHMERIQKQEDILNQKYEQLIKSRNKKELHQKEDFKKDDKIKDKEDKEIFQSLIDNFSTDEEDKNFVVSDAEISEEDAASDFEVTFLKLKDSQSQDSDNEEEALNSSPSKASIKMRRKQRNSSSKWRRINTRVESNESEDSESNGNEEYDRGCELHTAVKKNDIGLVKKLLRQDPSSVHDLGYRKRSALHLAALNGNAEIVQLLLKSKANCKLQDKYGFAPIAYAANGHSDCLKLLLKNTDIKKVHKALVQTDSKMSLLHLAIGESRTGEDFAERGKCLELLFAHDKSACVKILEHKDARERAPLEAAVYALQHQCVEVLLKNGANPVSFKTGEGGNLLHFAVESASHLKRVTAEDTDSSLCLRHLVELLNLHLNDKDSHDFTPLMYACESGNDECLLALIEAGATVVTKDNFGTSPLHLAAMAGSTECVQLLLSSSHPVDCVDKCGWPPLLYADFNAQEECVLALMKPKPDQLFVLGNLLKRQRNEEDKKKTFKVVKNVLISLANHDAYYTVFNDFIRVNPELLDEYNHGLLQHTWRAILDFSNKNRWFKRRMNALKDTMCWDSGPSLTVKRGDVLGSTMQRIGQVPGHILRRSMNVTFENEPGICTGPKREFFVCFCKDAVESSRGLFVVTDDCQYSPVPNAYFSAFVPEVSEPKSSSPKESKQEVKQEPTSTDKQIDVISEECTDSELLAVDITDTVDSLDVLDDCTDSELVTALEAATDSGICTSNVSSSQLIPSQTSSSTTSTAGNEEAMDSDSDVHGTTSEEPSSSYAETSSSQESQVDDDSQSSNNQPDENTWISCVGKKEVVVTSIALRSKMKQLRLIGRLVGSAICQDMLLNFHLSKPFVKQVLGIPLSHPDDLASFDHQLHQNMVIWVQDNSVNDLDLPFSFDALNPWTDKPVTVNLSDDENKTVDDTNKHEYIKLVSQYKLETFIEKEVEEFRTGLNEVIPRDLLSFFTADEFSLLLNGVTKIDVEDWKQNTLSSGFAIGSQIITWFWDIVSKLKEEEKALLLKFSTGSPCVPLGGFANLRGYSGPNLFTISKHFGKNKIPEAATCFNLLKLTDYDSEKELREKLLIAIRHGSEGFSFS